MDKNTPQAKMKILICGTRKKGYQGIVNDTLNSIKIGFEVIEGCCPDSADEYAEKWAKDRKIKLYHFPSTSGNYLKRNIEMVTIADMVIAFWDGFSYGTAHTIAQAVKKGIPITIIDIRRNT